METTQKFLELGYTLEFKTNPNGKPVAQAYKIAEKSRLKYKKFLFNFFFATEERMNEFINQKLKELTERKEKQEREKKQKQEAAKSIKASQYFKLGDIIVNTWGWEQSNVDYYKIIGLTDKCIRVRSIGSKIEEKSIYSHGMACNVLPDPEKEGDKEYLLKLKPSHDLKSIYICNPERYYYFHKWDGRSNYCSWYA